MTRPNSLPLLPPWGVQYVLLVFGCFGFLLFDFCWFLGSLFFGFLFSGSLFMFLKGWQNNTKVKDLTRCQFAHFRGCKLAFGCFIDWFGSAVPLENNVKTMENAGITGGSLGGLGHGLGNFDQSCMFKYFSKCVLKTLQKYGQPRNL